MKGPLIASGVFLIIMASLPWIVMLGGIYGDYVTWVLKG